ncbi:MULTISPECIES: hypothetical protein [Hyphobacterium]|uniref:Uncharacterized protein n=1 Tax=Hyphobacterium vulgare TaxID=1736751 RepID=A0ABV6ZX35_9PROT
MKLKIRRSQKSGLTGKVSFAIDVMAELTDHERALCDKYRLWNDVVYSSEGSDGKAARAQEGNILALGSLALDRMTKRIFSVKDLTSGQHIEGKDLVEVIAAENQVKQACGSLRTYLDAASQFDGSEDVIEFAG